MLKKITMPAGGQTTDTSVIGNWFVKCGDKVKRGDPLLEIETDKATLTVESFASGTVLKILAETGEERSAGDVIAYIGNEGDLEAETKQAPAPQPSAPAAVEAANEDEDEYLSISGNLPAQAPAAQPIKPPAPKSDIKAMPNAKKLAQQQDVSLEEIADALQKTTLKRADVEQYLADKKAPATVQAVTAVPLTTMRKVIAKRMCQSAQTIPMFRASVEIDMTAITALRKAANASSEVKIAYHDIFCKCVDAAVRSHPYVNASFGENEILLHNNVNVGIAVSILDGLVVPVVKSVESKRISEIAAQSGELIRRARQGKLSPQEMSGGTITISNLGIYPVTSFDAIVNPPEVCILALSAIVDRPVLVDGQWKAVPTMTVTGTFDHRVVDGAYGAAFLADLKRLAENPAQILL